MTPNTHEYAKRMATLTRSRMKILLERRKSLEDQVLALDAQINECKNLCPHLIQKHHPRQIAEDDDYYVCEDCGATI